MIKKSQRIWIIFLGLFIVFVAVFAAPKKEGKNIYAVNCSHSSYSNGFCENCGKYEKPTLDGGYYKIDNAGKLYWFASVVNNNMSNCVNPLSSYNDSIYGKLECNINIPEKNPAKPNEDLFWTPIGKRWSGSVGYGGNFDGNGYYISGIHCNNANYYNNTKHIGLFGSVHKKGSYTPTIKNLGIKNSSFLVNGEGCLCAGAIAGNCEYGSIEGCYVEDNVNISCKSTNNDVQVGGLISHINNGTEIFHSYSKANINVETASNQKSIMAGGIVGCANNHNTNIKNCYSTGNIVATSNGSFYGGKILGYYENGTNINTRMANNYSLILSTIMNNGALYTVNTNTYNGTEKTSEQFKNGEVAYLLNGGDSDIITSEQTMWYQSIDNNLKPHDNYPVLDSKRGMVYTGKICNGSDVFYTNYLNYKENHAFDDNGFCTRCGKYQSCQGSGTSDDPYTIETAGQLYWFAAVVNNELDKCADSPSEYNPSACAKLTKDITINTFEQMNSENPRLWRPIGTYISGEGNYYPNLYKGTFDGQNYTISGIKVSMVSESTTKVFAGFFGEIDGATIQNVGITNFNVVSANQAYIYIGGLVGYQKNSTIVNCYATGNVDVSNLGSNYAGDLVGYQEGGIIVNCYTTGSVNVSNSGEDYAGGLVGYQGYGTIVNCYSVSDVNVLNSGKNYVGGFVGFQAGVDNFISSISNVHAMGNIILNTSGEIYAGAILGGCDASVDNTTSSWYYLDSSIITNHGSGKLIKKIEGNAKTTVEFKNFVVKDLLQNYVNDNSTLSPPLLYWAQGENYPIFNKEKRLKANLSWGNMIFAYDPILDSWSLPEGDEKGNVITFVNKSTDAKLKYSAEYKNTSVSGITGTISYFSDGVEYIPEPEGCVIVNSFDMMDGVSSMDTTLTLSGTPSVNGFNKTDKNHPIQIGNVIITISG